MDESGPLAFAAMLHGALHGSIRLKHISSVASLNMEVGKVFH